MYGKSIFFIIILVVLVLQGCQQEAQKSPSPQTAKTKITVGGKTWNINPNRAYQATGVWVNPNPRPLTAAEQARLAKVQEKLKTLSIQTDKLSDEASYLQRLDKPTLKVRYHFGMPPHSTAGDIIDLGEFPMEMREFSPRQDE